MCWTSTSRMYQWTLLLKTLLLLRLTSKRIKIKFWVYRLMSWRKTKNYHTVNLIPTIHLIWIEIRLHLQIHDHQEKLRLNNISKLSFEISASSNSFNLNRNSITFTNSRPPRKDAFEESEISFGISASSNSLNLKRNDHRYSFNNSLCHNNTSHNRLPKRFKNSNTENLDNHRNRALEIKLEQFRIHKNSFIMMSIIDRFQFIII